MCTGFRSDIQGLRAVAVLLVVAYHAGLPVSGGFLGVDVFFVISGFLITGLLLDELWSTGRIRFGAFVGRRVRRLLPALAVMTTVTVAVSHYVVELGRPLRAVADTGVAASLFAANFQLYRAVDYFAPDAYRNPLLHTWSLSVEEQFYLVLPLALMGLWWLFRTTEDRESALRRSLVVGAVASLALAVALVDLDEVPGFDDPGRLAFYLPLTRAWEFLAGSLLALHVRRPGAEGWVGGGSRRAENVRALGAALVLGSAFLLTGSANVPGLVTLPAVAGTALLIRVGSAGGHGALGRLLSSRAMNWIGDRSYGWYLWHWPLLVLFRAVGPSDLMSTSLALVASLALADASYRFVETPMRRLNRTSSWRITTLAAAASIAVPVLLSVAVARASEGDPSQLAGRDEPERGCTNGEPWSDDCMIDITTGSAPVILLVGDSHCRSLVPGVIEVAGRVGMDVAVLCRDATPFIDATPGTPSGDAFARVELALPIVEPAVVIVSNRSRRNLAPDAWERWSDVDFTGREAAATRWGERVGSAARALTARGAQVVWLAQVPEFPDVTSMRGSRLIPFVPVEIDATELDQQRADVLAAEAAALSGLDSVLYLDPAESLCSPDCSNGVGRTPHYDDVHHLSADGARSLVPLLERAVVGAPHP